MAGISISVSTRAASLQRHDQSQLSYAEASEGILLWDLAGFNPAKRRGAKQDGGGRRTRTFEVIRRLIYSQLPLPLGTLPRSTASEPTRRNGDGQGHRWR